MPGVESSRSDATFVKVPRFGNTRTVGSGAALALAPQSRKPRRQHRNLLEQEIRP